MNKDQVKGKANIATGKVQKKVGEATGSEKQQVKGVVKQIKGKVQVGVGNVKEEIKDTGKGKRR